MKHKKRRYFYPPNRKALTEKEHALDGAHTIRHVFELPRRAKAWRYINEDRAIRALIRWEDVSPINLYSSYAVATYREHMAPYIRSMRPYYSQLYPGQHVAYPFRAGKSIIVGMDGAHTVRAEKLPVSRRLSRPTERKSHE